VIFFFAVFCFQLAYLDASQFTVSLFPRAKKKEEENEQENA